MDEPTEEPLDCPKKWIYHPKTGSCYRTFGGTKNITWLEADKLCGDAGKFYFFFVCISDDGSRTRSQGFSA